jgi:hypothetical protein
VIKGKILKCESPSLPKGFEWKGKRLIPNYPKLVQNVKSYFWARLMPMLRKMSNETVARIHDGLIAKHLVVLVALIGMNGAIA